MKQICELLPQCRNRTANGHLTSIQYILKASLWILFRLQTDCQPNGRFCFWRSVSKAWEHGHRYPSSYLPRTHPLFCTVTDCHCVSKLCATGRDQVINVRGVPLQTSAWGEACVGDSSTVETLLNHSRGNKFLSLPTLCRASIKLAARVWGPLAAEVTCSFLDIWAFWAHSVERTVPRSVG